MGLAAALIKGASPIPPLHTLKSSLKPLICTALSFSSLHSHPQSLSSSVRPRIQRCSVRHPRLTVSLEVALHRCSRTEVHWRAPQGITEQHTGLETTNPRGRELKL